MLYVARHSTHIPMHKLSSNWRNTITVLNKCTEKERERERERARRDFSPTEEKATVEESSLNLNESSPKGMWDTPRSTGRGFLGLMRPKWSFLAIRLDTMFGRSLQTHYPQCEAWQPDSVCKRTTAWEKIHFPARQWPEGYSESYTEMV